jgi:hypothetical protein
MDTEPNFWDTIGGPKNPNPTGSDLPFTLFGYEPTIAFAVVGLVSFLLTAGPQLWYVIKKRGSHRTFHILMLTGCVSLLVGLANAQKADNLVVRVGRICSQDTCPFQLVSGGELFSSISLADSGESAHTPLKYWH